MRQHTHTQDDIEAREGVGERIIGYIENHLDGFSESSRETLRECLPHIETLIEGACPVLVDPLPEGMRVGYGVIDQIADENVIVVFATPEKATLLCCDEWPRVDLKKLRALMDNPADNLVNVLTTTLFTLAKEYKTDAERENEKFGRGILNAVSVMLDLQGKKAANIEMAKKIRAAGLAPIVFVLVGSTKPGLVSAAVCTLAAPRLNAA
jgi:hypothetical protein